MPAHETDLDLARFNCPAIVLTDGASALGRQKDRCRHAAHSFDLTSLVDMAVFCSIHVRRSRRRYRMARPARTNRGPPPLTRHACRVRIEMFRRSAVCTSVRSASASSVLAECIGLSPVGFISEKRSGTRPYRLPSASTGNNFKNLATKIGATI